LVLVMMACTSPNPAFEDSDDTSEDTTSSSGVPGDGDPGDGDGDTGDGDGGTGDGDGDGDSGDGDSGDGDGDPIACEPPGEPVDPHNPLVLNSVSGVDATNAPQFDVGYPADCYTVTICVAAQGTCGPTSSFLARYRNGGAFSMGSMSLALTPIKLAFHSGTNPCGEPLMWGTEQSLELIYNDMPNGQHKTVSILLPCLDGDPPTVWVGADGSTFWDPELTLPAALW
jgi:hypothetical protein